MKLAVCDDDDVFLQKLKNDILKTSADCSMLCEIDAYTEAESLHKVLEDKIYDGVFLDIDVPHIDGFSMAERVKKTCKNTLIIFCTNHNELVYDSFSYQPFWFSRCASATCLAILFNRSFKTI